MPGGRSNLYKPENAEIAPLACMLGVADVELPPEMRAVSALPKERAND
jgi:hypothetical protein